MSRRNIVLAVSLATLVGLVSWALPLGELLEFVTFRLAPERFKTDHLVLLVQPNSQQRILLVGTVHHDHVAPDATYSLWALQSVLWRFRPDKVLVEVKPEAGRKDRWAEGPIEMAFCALSAKQMGIPVAGMDFWNSKPGGAGLVRNSDEREDRMFENTRQELTGFPKVVIFTGFSHVAGFSARLEKAGFRTEPLSKPEKLALLNGPVERVCPATWKASVEQAIRRSRSGESEFSADWASGRERFLKRISEVCPHTH